MLRATFMFSMVVATVGVKVGASMAMGIDIDDGEIRRGVARGPVEETTLDAQITKEPLNEEAKKLNAVIAEGQIDKKLNAAIAEGKADLKVPVPRVQPPQDASPESSGPEVSTQDGFSVKDGKISSSSDSKGGMARNQNWEKPAESDPNAGRGILGLSVVVLVGLAIVGAFFAMPAAMKDEKGLKGQEMASIASSVSLGVKPRAPPAALPQGLQEVDVLETFDSFDKKRRGFIEADVLEGLLGPDESAQKDATKVVGNVDRLFYHDFRRLVLQKGPVQDAVLNMASRKRGSPVELS